ncbi:hypothetical protein RYX36_003093 [Vicia faba]
MLVASSYGWYYRACHACSCMACEEKPPFECEAGRLTEAEIFRCYYFSSDICCRVENDALARLHDPLEFPLELDHMLDVKMAFKVKWHPHWKNCSVVMLLKNDPFIKKLSDQLEIVENLSFDRTLIEHVKEPVPLHSISSNPLQPDIQNFLIRFVCGMKLIPNLEFFWTWQKTTILSQDTFPH